MNNIPIHVLVCVIVTHMLSIKLNFVLFSENRVFGVQLKDLLQADQQRIPGTQIPLLFDAVRSV